MLDLPPEAIIFTKILLCSLDDNRTKAVKSKLLLILVTPPSIKLNKLILTVTTVASMVTSYLI